MSINPNLAHALWFSLGLFCHLFALSMFFYFPGVEDWTFSTLHPFGLSSPAALGPNLWINLLLVFAVVLPGVSGPVLLMQRGRRFGKANLIAGCLALAGLHLLAAFAPPLLYGRVALIALLTGQLLALGRSHGNSIFCNWMVYVGFLVANLDFPDAGILAGANCFAGCYLLCAGVLLLAKARKPTLARKA